MNRKFTVVFCCVVLLIALGSLWYRYKPATVKIPRQEIVGVQTGLGEVLAEITVNTVPARGRVVVIATATHEQLKQRSNYLWNTFEGELQKHSISFSVDECPLNAWNSGSLPADQAAFKEVLTRHANADAIVFLVDLPEWGRVAEVLPQKGGGKIIAVDNLRQQMKPRYGGYFTSGMLAALIGARPQSIPGVPVSPKTPREWFEKTFQVYTPQNQESLPD